MKICYLANANSVHTRRWAKHFSSLGNEVTIISFQHAKIAGIKVIQPASFPSRQGNFIINLIKLRSVINKVKPNIVHAHYVTSYGFAGAVINKHPLVITAWGTDVLIRPDESWIYHQMVRFALRRADLVTSMAQHMTELLTTRNYVSPERIVTLPFGVDTSLFNLERRTREHGTEYPIVVSTRRLDKGLDVHVFVHSIPTVLKRFPDSRFIIAGDGLLRSQIEKLVGKLKIAGSVEILGEIQHSELPKLLGQADVFVSTSPSDGNNISLNEAMACGAFPVATDIPANRSWIICGHNGLLFPCQDVQTLANCIIRAIEQPDWRKAVEDENWEIIEKRASWTKEMKRMEDLYSKLIQQ